MSTCPDCGNSIPPESAAAGCPKCLLTLGLADATDTLAAETGNEGFQERSGDRIGHYKLMEIIGEGAFGVVWMAEQERPVRRRVALKVIKFGMDTRAVVARFEAERQALAMMDHPHIAHVFDGGATERGRPYFVMELVRGVPLTDFCEIRQLNTDQRIDLFITVCEAVQHAHQKGIIHRDLKPSNILVTVLDSRPQAKVIDFGIAKATGTAQSLTPKTFFTHFNQFLGTPTYMSPEQTGLGGLDIDTRTDVYSLGVILYELVTGRPPFDLDGLAKAGFEAAQKMIREKDPPKPSARLSTLSREELLKVAAGRSQNAETLAGQVRGELDWIILKALEKDRSRRYQSAAELASDLQRFRNNEPITAAPPSFKYQFTKFARKNRTALITSAAFLLVLILGIVISTWQAFRATHLAASAERSTLEALAANRLALANLAQARLNEYASEMNSAQQSLAEGNLERTLQLLEKQRPGPDETNDLRGFEWRYLWRLSQPNHTAIFQDAAAEGFANCSVAVSPDGKWLAYGSTNGVVVRDLATRQIAARLPGFALTLSFSPDSKLLATAKLYQPPVRLWDTHTWNEIPAQPLTNAIAPAFFSPDGRWLISGHAKTNLLQLRQAGSWNVVASCPGTPHLAVSLRGAVAFSADGRWLVTPWMKVSRDGGGAGLHVWKLPTLEKHAELFAPDIPLQSAVFLPDSNHLLTGGWLGHLLVWDLTTNPPRIIQQEHEHTTYIPALTISPNGQTFATGSADQSICLWDTRTRKRIARWRGHRREVWGLAMSSDGETVASSSPDGTIRFWNGSPTDTSNWVESGGDIAGFTADGRALILAPGEGDYRWQLITETNRLAISVPDDPPLEFDFIRPYAVTGNKPLAAIGRTRGKLEVWDLERGSLSASWNPGTSRITAVCFSPDGLNLAAGDDEGMVRLFRLGQSNEIWKLKVLNSHVTALAFSPDGQWLATGNQNSHQTCVWDLQSLKEVTRIRAEVNKITFAPDGKSIVTCTVNGNEARLWELPSGREIAKLKGHLGGMSEATFSPDGRTLATGAYDGRIKLWNTASGQEVGTLPYQGMITGLQFSPDGQTLAVSIWASPGYRALLFRAPSFETIDAPPIDKEH